jgi:amidase
VTSAGLPGPVEPSERGDNPLPIGAQIIGPCHEVRTVLTFAVVVEREFGGSMPPPGDAG